MATPSEWVCVPRLPRTNSTTGNRSQPRDGSMEAELGNAPALSPRSEQQLSTTETASEGSTATFVTSDTEQPRQHANRDTRMPPTTTAQPSFPWYKHAAVMELQTIIQTEGSEATRLRSEIHELRWQLHSQERNIAEEEQKRLKDLRALLAGTEPDRSNVLVSLTLLDDAARIIGRQRDDRGPLQHEIHRLELNLDNANYKIEQAQHELSRILLTAARKAEPSEAILAAHRLTNSTSVREIPRSQMGQPPDHHPLYVHWQDQVKHVQRLDVKISECMNERKMFSSGKRETKAVGAQSRSLDEAELQRLQVKLQNLEGEWAEGITDACISRNDCLREGIIGEDGAPIHVGSTTTAQEGDDTAYKPEASEIWRHGPAVKSRFDPSKYHQKFLKWRHLRATLKLLEEEIENLRRSWSRLEERKQRREQVKLHLSTADYEKWERLPAKIARKELKYEAGLEELEKLKDECLREGIMDVDETPVEQNIPALEAWSIIPSKGNTAKKRPKKKRWLKSSTKPLDLTQDRIMEAIQRLDSSRPNTQKEVGFGRDQLEHADKICRLKNYAEPDDRFHWVVAQLERNYERISQQPGSKITSAITVYLRRELRPESSPSNTSDSAEQGDEQDSSASSSSFEDGSSSSYDGETQSELKYEPGDFPQHILVNLEVSPASQKEDGSDTAHSVHNELLKPGNQDLTQSRTSALTQFALTANSQRSTGPEYGGLQSRIDPWLFGVLAESYAEVRMIATVMQAAGVLLWESTAQQIMQYWNQLEQQGRTERSESMSGVTREGISLAKHWSEAVESRKQEEYDKLLVGPTNGYLLEWGERRAEDSVIAAMLESPARKETRKRTRL